MYVCNTSMCCTVRTYSHRSKYIFLVFSRGSEAYFRDAGTCSPIKQQKREKLKNLNDTKFVVSAAHIFALLTWQQQE